MLSEKPPRQDDWIPPKPWGKASIPCHDLPKKLCKNYCWFLRGWLLACLTFSWWVHKKRWAFFHEFDQITPRTERAPECWFSECCSYYVLQNTLLVSVSKDFDVITTCNGHSFHQPWDGRMVVLWCESHRDSRSSYERYWKILYQAGRIRKKSSCPIAVRAQGKWKFLPRQRYIHPSWYSHPIVYKEPQFHCFSGP